MLSSFGSAPSVLSSDLLALLTQPGFFCISLLLGEAGGGFPGRFGCIWEACVGAVLLLGLLLLLRMGRKLCS